MHHLSLGGIFQIYHISTLGIQGTESDCILTVSHTTILDSSKLKEFADNSFKFDENGRKFSKREENTVGKGEIALYEQFLLFLQCFQKTCTVDT